MSYKFKIEQVNVLTGNQIYLVTGLLVQGEVEKDTIARVKLDDAVQDIHITSVAMMDPPPEDINKKTLRIKQPNFDCKLLVGKTIEG